MAISPNYHCAAEGSKGNITYAPIAILTQATMAGNFGKARLAMSTSVARARWHLLSGLGNERPMLCGLIVYVFQQNKGCTRIYQVTEYWKFKMVGPSGISFL